MSTEKSPSLPKWAEKMTDDWIDEGNHTHQDVINLREALTIAVEALLEIDPPLNSSDHGCWKIAREALRRIEESAK